MPPPSDRPRVSPGSRAPEWIGDHIDLPEKPARSRRGGPRGGGREPAEGMWSGWVLPLALVAAVNLCTRRVDEPLRQLAFYCGTMAALLLSERLRRTLPRAQALVLVGAALYVGVSQHDALRSRRLPVGDAVGQAVHAGTGLGRGVGEALRVAAQGQPSTAPFTRYLDKVDARSSDIVILASRLAGSCESADHLCEASTVMRFVTDDIQYRSDPRGADDYVKTPQETLAAGAGDCEDKSILVVSLLEALGNRTWLVFTREHVWPLACFDEPLPELWRQRTARMSAEARIAYANRLWPKQGADELERLINAADEIEIDDRACYAIEPTAGNSFFGAYHRGKDYLVAVDPIARKAVDLAKAGLPVTR